MRWASVIAGGVHRLVVSPAPDGGGFLGSEAGRRFAAPPLALARHPSDSARTGSDTWDETGSAWDDTSTGAGSGAADDYPATTAGHCTGNDLAGHARASAACDVNTPALSPALRAELERPFSSEVEAAPFAARKPGTYGTLAALSSGGVPQMIGDLGPLPQMSLTRLATGGSGLPSPFPLQNHPGCPVPEGPIWLFRRSAPVKISEDQSLTPRPQDLVAACDFTFQLYFRKGVNDQVNQRLQSPIGYTQIFRYIAGYEKTFLDGKGSIGLRVPLDSVTANTASSRASGNFGGTSTAVGDMSIYGKYILLENRETGSLLSSGLAVTAPTGPGRFAGLDTFAPSPHGTSFQPFIGYIYNTGKLYFHGFTIVDVTTTGRDPVLMYNDFGVRLLPPPARSKCLGYAVDFDDCPDV